MTNLDIVYERDIYRSYMKMPAGEEPNLDEKILLSSSIEGLLPMEKHFFQGKGQYWYDISGKMALDNYCRTQDVDDTLFKRLILQICNQLERFEWRLLKAECLQLRPETIFISVSDEKIFFTGYPQEGGSIFRELQTLMDFLLMKINHSDAEAVRRAYELYEIIVKGEFQIEDLKNCIWEKQEENIVAEVSVVPPEEREVLVKEEPLVVDDLFDKILGLCKNVWARLRQTENEESQIVYPDEVEERPIMTTIHPTVCLTSIKETAEGILMYEGIEKFGDFELGKMSCSVGKSPKAKLCIEKDTISHFHAQIDWKEDGYYIEDLNSTNGTYVNEEQLNTRECKKLYSGDVIRFADVKYRFL